MVIAKNTKVLLCEFPSTPISKIEFNDQIMKLWSSVTVAKKKKGHYPEFVGGKKIDDNNLDSFEFENIGGWALSLLPHIEDLAVCDYLKLSSNNAKEAIVEISDKTDNTGYLILLLSFISAHLLIVKNLILELKKKYHNIIVVVGGRHATAEPLETLWITNADVVVVGEADHLIRSLIKSLIDRQKIRHPSIIYKGDHREPISTFSDFSNREYSWDLFFNETNCLNQYTPQLIFERHCPALCGFCSRLMCRKSFPNIGSKIITWMDEYFERIDNKKGVFLEIEDPAINFEEYFYNGIFEYFSSKNIKWEGMCRVRCETEKKSDDFFSAAKNSGCLSLFIGVESFQQNVLDLLQKKVCSDDIEPFMAKLKDVGIGTALNLIVGLPGQSCEDFQNDVDRTCKLITDGIVDVAGVTFLSLYPGTKFRKNPSAYGITLHDSNYENLELQVQHSTKLLSSELIMELYEWALNKLVYAMQLSN